MINKTKKTLCFMLALIMLLSSAACSESTENAETDSAPVSDAVSADLQKRGMKFVGSTIIYSYLQAIGMICSHDRSCFLYKGN